jgi:uncharacterized SAM-binding protein YcdF (DUF218 family)
VKLIARTLFVVSVIVFTFALIVAGNYLTLPAHNTDATHFDTLIVLGTPAKQDGTPSPEQRERVLEGVREYKAGVAPRIIMTGGAAHNQFVEAHVMDELAQSQGVPAGAIVEETQALNTVQNLYYSAQIMHQEGWSSAEIVSSPSHLPRAALIANMLNIDQPSLSIDWRTHAARWPPEYGVLHRLLLYAGEAYYCLRLRVYRFPSSKFLPSR